MENKIVRNHSNTVYLERRIFSGYWDDLLQVFNVFLNEQLHLTQKILIHEKYCSCYEPMILTVLLNCFISLQSDQIIHIMLN